MNIYEYFSYDPEINFSPQEHTVASCYVNLCLLKICVEEYFADTKRKYPLGFADHDWGTTLKIKPVP